MVSGRFRELLGTPGVDFNCLGMVLAAALAQSIDSKAYALQGIPGSFWWFASKLELKAITRPFVAHAPNPPAPCSRIRRIRQPLACLAFR